MKKKSIVIQSILVIFLILGIISYFLADRYLIQHVELTNVYAAAPETSTATGIAAASDSTSSTDTAASGSAVTETIVADDWNYQRSDVSISIREVITGSGQNKVTYFVADVVLSDATQLASAFADNSFGRNIIAYTVTDQQSAQLSAAVQTYYTSNGSLDGFFEYYRKFGAPAFDQGQPTNPGSPPSRKDELRGVYGLVDTEYRAAFPTLGYGIGQTVPKDMIKQTIAVEVDGKTIAWILPDTSHQFQLSPQEQQFLTRSTLAIVLAALVGMLAAVAMGFLLADRLTKPISRLTKASQALAHGDLQQKVPVTSQDELSQLTATFNQMSADLVHADQQRKRMTADITHDLSTPLQIISGYMEILETGDLSLTPQRVEIIRTELDHLRLVNDLTTLTQVESGSLDVQLSPVHPSELLERIYQAYQPIAAHQHVDLVLDVSPSTCPTILADDVRMLQVLKNYMDNALR